MTQLRSNFAGLLEPIFEKETATKLEEKVYLWAIREAKERGFKGFHEDRYCSKARTLLNNLDEKSHVGNCHLAKKIRELSPEELEDLDICSLLLEEQFPERWEEIIKENKMKEEKRKERLNREGYYRCFRCGGKRTVYQIAQLRSCDEPMSILVNCLDCGNSWRG